MKTLLALVTLTAIVSTAVAKGNPDPKLPKEIQQLYGMVGDWKSRTGSPSSTARSRTSGGGSPMR